MQINVRAIATGASIFLAALGGAAGTGFLLRQSIMASDASPVSVATAAGLGQFDLECKTKKSSLARHGNKFSAEVLATRLLRIDLVSNRWCEGKCEFGTPLIAVTVNDLTFADDPTDPDGFSNSKSSINRNTGRYFTITHEDGRTDLETGECIMKPYTTVPSPRF